MALASASSAQTANQRMEGMKGIGFFNAAAPLGIRYWMNDGMAVDFGVGLDVDTKVANPGDPTTDDTLFGFAVDIGLPIVMSGQENMIVYFRPGATLRGTNVFENTGVAGAQQTVTDIAVDVGLAIGGEFFLTQFGWDNLSFSGQVGVNLEILSPGADNSETDVNFTTTNSNVSVFNSGQVGFRIYFN